VGKKLPKILGPFCVHRIFKTAQRKLSPNMRKFAQSGHPAFKEVAGQQLNAGRGQKNYSTRCTKWKKWQKNGKMTAISKNINVI
jgi:hypothetical protein